MKTLLHSRDRSSKGAALIIVLAFVVLLTGLAVAYFSRTTTDRQLAQSSFNDTSADLLARSALDIAVSDFKQELLNDPTTATSANIQPQQSGSDASIPNLIRRSVFPDSIPAPGVASLASNVSSGPVDPTNPKRGEVTSARWNSHYLIPSGANFSAPSWVLVTRNGPASFSVWQDSLKDSTPTNANYVVGRYAFAVYDEGGLVDMNLAGYATGTSSGGGPAPTPTPWLTNVGRKGIVAFADLTALPATQAQINSIVGWRNYATTGQSFAGFPSTAPSFLGNLNRQDNYGSYLLDFGDPPYPTPCPTYPFTSVATATSSSRTDQAIMTRQELLKLESPIGFSQNVLQYMGTFSRERNQPARDWNNLINRIRDRFDIGMIGMVQPNPNNTANGRGRGQGHGNGGNFKGRGHWKGDVGTIRDLFGLVWVHANGSITDPHNVNYWGHWLYVGTPPLPNGNPHIPVLRGGRNDFFQLLDYCTGSQALATADDANPARMLGLGASLIDQYDSPGSTGTDDVDTVGVVGTGAHVTGTHVTIIQYGDANGTQFVLGWENGEVPAASDTNPTQPHNPYNWITSNGTSSGTKKTPPTFTPIVLNHGFTTVGDLGYGLKTENGFTPVDFHTWPQVAGSLDSALLDFFTYNPVDHNYPRVGIANLNTKNVPVIAAILQSTLKKDIDVTNPPSFPTISSTEATNAAQAIVNTTSTLPALNRADIVRLASTAAGAISFTGSSTEETDKGKETIARALSEIGQARTWNLMIDVIAQTGRYGPNAQGFTDFIVQGEKRYWLHIALGRDLNGTSVDVLGAQLEEVTE
jgi:hypothetical protein